jgi:hypothetical protein
MFPRWLFPCFASSPSSSAYDSKEKIPALLVSGNSELENKFDFAQKFPKVNLKRGEIIIMNSIVEKLGLQKNDKI